MSATPAQTRTETLEVALVNLLSPVLADVQLELVDVVTTGIGTTAATVQVLVEHFSDHPAGPRIDLDGVAQATRLVDETLETNDPVPGAYTLEVSSPGLERPLRTPAHFQRFLGANVALKTKPGTEGERRIEGRLEKADADESGAIVVAGRSIAYADIDRARTVFVWGPQAKPSGPAKKAAKPKRLVASNTEGATDAAKEDAATRVTKDVATEKTNNAQPEHTPRSRTDKQVTSVDATDHNSEETQ